MSRDLTRLPHTLDPAKRTCRAIIETLKGRRAKYDYDPDLGLFKLKSLLPDGESFPLDFGFCTVHLWDDGDPLDIMVLSDEPGVTGSLLDVRLIGVVEAEQAEDGKVERNDRLVGVGALITMPSTVIAGIYYEPARRELDVLFRTDWLYRYFDVPEIEFERLAAAASKGAYFNANIRTSYRYR
jgi:hypothetical protein